MTTSDQCINCKNYLGLLRCEAYPDGIPDKILGGLHNHNLHYPGDNASGKHIHFEKLVK